MNDGLDPGHAVSEGVQITDLGSDHLEPGVILMRCQMPLPPRGEIVVHAYGLDRGVSQQAVDKMSADEPGATHHLHPPWPIVLLTPGHRPRPGSLFIAIPISSPPEPRRDARPASATRRRTDPLCAGSRDPGREEESPRTSPSPLR